MRNIRSTAFQKTKATVRKSMKYGIPSKPKSSKLISSVVTGQFVAPQKTAAMSDSAAEKKAEAESIEQQYADKISAAEEEISAMRAKAAKDAEEIIKNARSDAEEEGRRILEDAHEKALKEKEGIVEDAKKDIIELVLAAEKKLLHKAEENDDK